MSVGLVLAVMPVGIAQGGPVDAQAMVAAHNAVRGQIGLGGLAWSNELAQVAEGWARQLEANQVWCREMIHNNDRPDRTGENMYASTVETAANAIVAAWLSEQQHYDYDSNTCAAGQECGHYIQVVWGESRELGCAATVCRDIPQPGSLWYVTICNYRPGLLFNQRPY